MQRKARELLESRQVGAQTEPKVVCGMTIIPADPSIDPRMLISPGNRDVKDTIRAIPPPVCQPQ